VEALPLARIDLRATVRDIVADFERHRLLFFASAISYSVLAALIPFTCFLLALLGALHLDSLWYDHLAPQIESHVSGAVYTVITETVQRILRHAAAFWVTAGAVLTVYEVSGAMRAVMRALDEIYGTRRGRRVRERIVVSVWLSIAAGALVLAALCVLVLGSLVVGSGLGSLVARVAVAALLLLGAVGLTVRFAPARPQPVGWVSFGTALIVTCWLATAGLYALYVTTIASYGSVFGNLAVAFVLIVFVNLSSVAFLLGALIDANVRRRA